MTEEENYDAKEAAPIVEEQTAVNADTAGQQSEDKQERNFKAIRESVQERDRRISDLEGKLRSFEEAAKPDLSSIDDEEIPTYKEIKSLNQKIEELRVMAKFPEVSELMNKYGNEIDPSMKKLMLSATDLEVAVAAADAACRKTPSYLNDMNPKQESPEAKRIINNANKVKSASGIGVSATVSKERKYSAMTTAERLALQRNFISGVRK